MSLTYQSVFGLNQNYTFQDLENAYNNKVNTIIDSKNINDVEKHLLVESMKKYFDKAYMSLARRNFFSSENLLTPVFETSLFQTRLPTLGESLKEMDSFYQDVKKDIATGQNQNTDIFSSSTTYKERTMPDGSKIIMKETSNNKNGDITRTTNSYRKLSNGVTEPIDYEQALLQLTHDKPKHV
jgi:hypothetical protein